MRTSRRTFLAGAGTMALLARPARAKPRRATIGHSVAALAYCQHMIAAKRGLFDAEGLEVPDAFVPGGGAKVVQALVAGQVLLALGDSSHPLKITEKGKPAVILFATDRRCPYANIVVRRALYDAGVTDVAALANEKLVGRKAIIAATALGSGTHVYGGYVLRQTRAADGRPVADAVEWVSGGGDFTMLGGLKAGRFDAIMASPDWIAKAVAEGFGRVVYDVQQEKAWDAVFGGPMPATVGYALRETVEKSPELVQGYVNACAAAQRWLHTASDGDVAELLAPAQRSAAAHKAILDALPIYRSIFQWDLALDEASFARSMQVLVPIAIDKPASFSAAVDTTFLRRARAKLE